MSGVGLYRFWSSATSGITNTSLPCFPARPSSQANAVLCKLLANNLYVLIRSIYSLGLTVEFTKIASAQKVSNLSEN